MPFFLRVKTPFVICAEVLLAVSPFGPLANPRPDPSFILGRPIKMCQPLTNLDS